MAFFTSAITTLQTLVIALGGGLGVWGLINLMEGYGNDNPGAKSQGVKHVIPNYVESRSRITKQNMLCISHTGELIKHYTMLINHSFCTLSATRPYAS